jgi:HK97 family phage prohead protease
MTHETRAFAAEVRTKGRKLEGYAALFGTEARIGGGMIETIRTGAFTNTLATREDILALVDHDPSRVLARTRSGSLRLKEDAKGLAFSLDLPDTTAGRDVLALAERGDLGGMSFGFNVPRGGHSVVGDKRELRAVELIEISIVSAFPAYDGTTVQARSLGQETPDTHTGRTLHILDLIT